MKAWDELPVMPPNIPEDMAKVCCSLKIYILKTSELPAVAALEQATKNPRDERFLECILRSQGNSIDKLSGIPLKAQDVDVRNSNCLAKVRFCSNSPSSSSKTNRNAA
jgi:hypothetical protein